MNTVHEYFSAVPRVPCSYNNTMQPQCSGTTPMQLYSIYLGQEGQLQYSQDCVYSADIIWSNLSIDYTSTKEKRKKMIGCALEWWCRVLLGNWKHNIIIHQEVQVQKSTTSNIRGHQGQLIYYRTQSYPQCQDDVNTPIEEQDYTKEKKAYLSPPSWSQVIVINSYQVRTNNFVFSHPGREKKGPWGQESKLDYGPNLAHTYGL